MNVRAPDAVGVDQEQGPVEVFGEPLKRECLAAPGRAVQHHGCGKLDPERLVALGILDDVDDVFPKERLKRPASGQTECFFPAFVRTLCSPSVPGPFSIPAMPWRPTAHPVIAVAGPTGPLDLRVLSSAASMSSRASCSSSQATRAVRRRSDVAAIATPAGQPSPEDLFVGCALGDRPRG